MSSGSSRPGSPPPPSTTPPPSVSSPPPPPTMQAVPPPMMPERPPPLAPPPPALAVDLSAVRTAPPPLNPAIRIRLPPAFAGAVRGVVAPEPADLSGSIAELTKLVGPSSTDALLMAMQEFSWIGGSRDEVVAGIIQLQHNILTFQINRERQREVEGRFAVADAKRIQGEKECEFLRARLQHYGDIGADTPCESCPSQSASAPPPPRGGRSRPPPPPPPPLDPRESRGPRKKSEGTNDSGPVIDAALTNWLPFNTRR